MLRTLHAPELVEERQGALGLLMGGTQSRYDYLDGEHELVVRMLDPVRDRIDAVREGSAHFALVIEDPLILFCTRFGDEVPWTASPYCWHLTPRERRVLPPLPNTPEERRGFLPITLWSHDDRQVLATRNVTLSLDFTRALNEAIREQAKMSFSPQVYKRALENVGRRYATGQALAARAIARSIGNP